MLQQEKGRGRPTPHINCKHFISYCTCMYLYGRPLAKPSTARTAAYIAFVTNYRVSELRRLLFILNLFHAADCCWPSAEQIKHACSLLLV